MSTEKPCNESLSDEQLLQRTAAGDRSAFGPIVERHQAAVLRFARGWVDRPEDAEEVLQQTFLAALTAAPSFRGESTVRTWMLSIARHAALKLRRQTRRDLVGDLPLEQLGVLAGWGSESPESWYRAANDLQRLRQALESLDAAERELITLRDLEQLSGSETARVVGLPLATMKTRLHRARLKLAALMREGATDAAR